MKNFEFVPFTELENPRSDIHMHTKFCDGREMPEAMVERALELGLHTMGFSRHSDPPNPYNGFMGYERALPYREELARLKEVYRDRIVILTGCERDFLSEEVFEDGNGEPYYDYILGSAHYIRFGDKFYPTDWKNEFLVQLADEQFGGDIYSVAETYFKMMGDMVDVTGADIIGHFDVISKFNEVNPIFDEENPRYVKAWKDALEKLISQGAVIELNTGAVSRGHKQSMRYPTDPMVDFIRDLGGRLTYGGDSHNTEFICYRFEDFTEPLKDILVVPVAL